MILVCLLKNLIDFLYNNLLLIISLIILQSRIYYKRIIQYSKEKLRKKTVPLSVLAEGLKDYAEEVSIKEAHELFSHLNNLLITVPAWTKNAPMLKQFFRDINKNSANPKIIMSGDYVVTKHVDNEVNSVAAGATGIVVTEDKQ